MGFRYGILLVLTLAPGLEAADVAKPDAAAKKPEKASYTKQIAPLVAKYCVGCHGGNKPKAGLAPKLPTDPDAYRGYAIGWIREARDAPTIQARWDGEEMLRERLGVSASDLAFIVPFLQGRLLDLGGARTVPAIPL